MAESLVQLVSSAFQAGASCVFKAIADCTKHTSHAVSLILFYAHQLLPNSYPPGYPHGQDNQYQLESRFTPSPLPPASLSSLLSLLFLLFLRLALPPLPFPFHYSLLRLCARALRFVMRGMPPPSLSLPPSSLFPLEGSSISPSSSSALLEDVGADSCG